MAEKKVNQGTVEKEFIEGPAGVSDKARFTGSNFATNREKTEARIGEGINFDNKALLELLGFRENAKGEMTLSATPNEVIKDAKGKVIKRKIDGRTLTGEKQPEEAERE